MNDLHRAFIVLGLEPGSSHESVMRRYKRLIMVWHPDRAPTGEHREFAEQELKKINKAKQTLTKHFGSGGGHREGRCECQPSVDVRRSKDKTLKGSPGPGYHRRKFDSADSGGGIAKSSEVSQAPAVASKQPSGRWINLGLIVVAAFILFSLSSWRSPSTEPKTGNQNVVPGAFPLPNGGSATASAPDPSQRTMSSGSPKAFSGNRTMAPASRMVSGGFPLPRKAPRAPSQRTMSRYRQAYSSDRSVAPSPRIVSGGFPLPNNGPATAGAPVTSQAPRNPEAFVSDSADPRTQRRPTLSQATRVQNVTMLEVERYEKQIERCNAELARIDTTLINPLIGEPERRKLSKMQLFQQKNLRMAQANLAVAKEKLVSGSSSPSPTNGESSRPGNNQNDPSMFQ